MLPTPDRASLEGKKVLMRVDINSALEPKTGIILDDSRFRGHLDTIRDFSSSKLALLAHQSRPGLEDFTPMEKHAEKLGSLLGKEVNYVDDAMGSAARREIEALGNGEVLLLENVRFYSEEVHRGVRKKPPEEQAKTNLVKKLSRYVDCYVNDAFAVCHRSQPSVIGFPLALPSFAGRLMEKEVKTLEGVAGSSEGPKIFSFGGAKVEDSLRATGKLLERGIADHILTSGLVANLFLLASGVDIGEVNTRSLGMDGKRVEEAKKLLKRYGDRVLVPEDVAVMKNSERAEVDVGSVSNIKIMDIGIETIATYTSMIKEAGTVVANGPCGVFEAEDFALGSEEIIKAMAKSGGFTCIGGGHLGALTSKLELRDKISFISTGGKAFILILSGEKLPGVEVLRNKGI